MAMRCILAVDNGGTKCEAIAVCDDGTIVGWGRCGFTDPGSGRDTHTGGGRSAVSIRSAVSQALQEASFNELHLVAYNNEVPQLLQEDFDATIVHHSVSESDGLLELAGQKYGILASAGTGAFVHAVTRDGRVLHLDSLGPLLGDFGSGYNIGAMAVQAAARADWHPRYKSPLKDVVYRSLGIKPVHPLGQSLVGALDTTRDRAIVAHLAHLVDDQARAGDRVSIEIIQDAAAALARTVYDAYDVLGMSDDDYCLVGTSSVVEKSDIYWAHLCKCVNDFAPNMRTSRTDLPHVVGTILHVLGVLSNGEAQIVKGRLLDCAHEMFSS